MELAKVKVQMNILQNDINDAVDEKDFLRAQELKLQMDSLDQEQKKLQEELTVADEKASRPSVDNAAKNVLQSNTSPDTPIEPKRMRKCLEVIFQLMQDTKIKSLKPSVMTLVEEIVLPAIRDLEPEIRQIAVKALGVCCLRSLEMAKRNLLLLFQVRCLTAIGILNVIA